MLHISDLRNNKNLIIERLKIKNFDCKDLIDVLISKDDERKILQQKSDDLLSKQNQIAKKIGELFKSGQTNEANELKETSAKIKKDSQELISLQNKIEDEIYNILVQIPNVPHKSVKAGASEKDNEILKEYGEKPKLFEHALPHWDLAEKFDLIAFKLGNKITG